MKAISGDCTCNATTILGLLKRDGDFTAAVRGAAGAAGADGRTGAPGLTVSVGKPRVVLVVLQIKEQ